MQTKTKSLRDNPIWKEATAIAEYMYDQVLSQFGDFNEEKWNTERKIRNASNDAMFYIAQAIGSSAPDTTEYEWNYAHKNLFALQTMYIFSGKQKFLKLDPQIVIRIDKLLTEIDKGIEFSKKEAERKVEKEMEPWLEKYRLWKMMNEDSSKIKPFKR